MCVCVFAWGRRLELRCHFEIGNVKNDSCVPIACIMCAYWVILSSWLRKKKTKPEFSSFFGTSFLIMPFANIRLVWMRWICEAASGSRKGWWGLGDERTEQKGKRLLNLSPFQQGYLVDGEGQGVEGNLAYAFSLKPVGVICYLFCFPLCRGGVFTDGKHCASARVVWGDAGGWRQKGVVRDERCSQRWRSSRTLVQMIALTCRELCLHICSHCDRRYRSRWNLWLLKRRQGQHLDNVTPGGSEITATPLSWIEFGFHICWVRELEKVRFGKRTRLAL